MQFSGGSNPILIGDLIGDAFTLTFLSLTVVSSNCSLSSFGRKKNGLSKCKEVRGTRINGLELVVGFDERISNSVPIHV